ncbi:MAG: GAF domain-containing sensor histidine kinase, partial [Chitinophagaceae bacterium]|nr:GAF domain-containing sensor histidine kinase [Anaerolineae bacterium]
SEMQKHPRSVGFPEHHPKMTNLLGVPIQTGAQLFGMLYLCDRVDGLPFDEQDQWWVEALAGYAALAIAGAQLSAQHQRLTLLEERERVGMELHDGVIQSLYAIGMHLQLMRLSNNITESGVDDSIHSLDQVIEDIRGYILNLKTSTYHQKTIQACLQEVIARLYVPETLSVQIDAPDRLPPFSAPVFEAVCQIAQEAASNVVRHANATTLKIQTTQKESMFTLSVSDNGTGFDPDDADLHEGLGLRNIQQRARIHGGKITVQTIPHQGTTVTLKIPLS